MRLASWRVVDGRGSVVASRHEDAGADPQTTLSTFARDLDERPAAVAHRFVHGGPTLLATCEIDRSVELELEVARPLAPLHLPRALAWLLASRAEWPDARQVAAFDTAFFRDLPRAASTYALPVEVRRAGIRRYGFHGLAHQAMWRGLVAARPDLAEGRAITFQLGAGCLAAAIDAGRPLDTSMGFTPLEGLVMATRAGDVDPGALLHLLANGPLGVADLQRILDEESGLRGLAGDGDMRRVLAREDDDARLAVDVYCHRARKVLGAYLAVLGGADAIVFGGGVGESAAPIRAGICEGFGWCGLDFDFDANARAGAGAQRIARRGSRIDVWIIPVDEQAVLLDEALRLLPFRS